MVVEKVVALNEEILEKLEEVLEKENAKKPKGEKLTIRILPEEIALYQQYVDLTEYKNISDLVRKAVREKIKNIILPKSLDTGVVEAGTEIYNHASPPKISLYTDFHKHDNRHLRI